MPILLRLLASPHWLVRVCAADALGASGDAAAIDELRAAGARERLLLRGPYRKAVRQIRRRNRSGLLGNWPSVTRETRRRLLIVALRVAVFAAIFTVLLKFAPGP
jgi:HEAT repeat protein